jgi:proteasome lid subunit RPN8/RPN11
VRIAEPVLEEIRRSLVAAYPLEGCGFLLGAVGADGSVVVARHLAMPNRRSGEPEATRRFLIGPSDHRSAEDAALAAGLAVVGTYHSHPDAPARPSAFDFEHAWPWYSYLIVSVSRGAAGEARAWRLRDDRSAFVEQRLDLTDA